MATSAFSEINRGLSPIVLEVLIRAWQLRLFQKLTVVCPLLFSSTKQITLTLMSLG